MLTPQQEAKINAEAERLYPIDAANILLHGEEKIKAIRSVYISAITPEIERGILLEKALEKIAELLSGEPSEENVSEAFVVANEALSSYWNPE